MSAGLAVTVALSLCFGFLNGLNDSASLVSTVISSRALPVRRALLLAAAGELAGPFLFGTAVAATMGRGLVRPEALTSSVLAAGLASAVLWGLLAWRLGLPSSSSHALVGGLLGAGVAATGGTGVLLDGLALVVLFLLLSPLVGLLLGYLALQLVLSAVQGSSPAVSLHFRRWQVVTSVALALSHGSNDGQKTMGMLAAALAAEGAQHGFAVPWWVVAASAVALASGTAVGGQRTIRTLGAQMYRVRPVHGFAAQGAAALVALGSALLGGPVSTTQVVTSSIVGVGTAQGLSRVRWGVATNIALAWAFVLPATALLAAIIHWAFRLMLST